MWRNNTFSQRNKVTKVQKGGWRSLKRSVSNIGVRDKIGGRNLLPTMICNGKTNKICLNQHADFLRFYFKKVFF